jgi:hypothetical protein
MAICSKDTLTAANFDAFGKLRTSSPTTLFDSQLQYNNGPLIWQESLVTGGTATHVNTQNAIKMSVTTTSGSSVIRRTKQYFRYQPGKSQMVFMTAVMGAAKANVRQRIGYFDGYDGLYFEQTSTGLYVAKRTYTSGSAVDTAVLQTSWNLDPMNGTGPSGVTIDTSKAQIFCIDFEYLGVGSVRFGFVIDGKLFYCHQMRHANSVTSVYMRCANLPVSYEITNTGTAASGTDMYQICCSVISEGGFEDSRGLSFSAANIVARNTNTTRLAMLNIRPKNVFNTLTNRGQIYIATINIMASSAPVLWELFYNGTTLANVAWNSVNTNSLVEFDIAATTIDVTNAVLIDSGFCAAAASSSRIATTQTITARLPFTLDITGYVPDIFSLCVTTPTGTGTAQGSITWKEVY